MSKFAVTAALVAQSFPASVVDGPIIFALLDAAGDVVTTQSVPAADADAVATTTFDIAVSGTYTVTATRQDANGKNLAPSVTSEAFSVTAPATISITVPSTVTVTPA